jgi:adenylate cyclase
VHQGDVIFEGSDLLGDGVNIAARLEARAEPGGICISGRVHEDAAAKIALQAHDMGEQQLKNITRPVRAYRISVASKPAKMDRASRERPGLPLPDKPSIVVLPFQNISRDPERFPIADLVWPYVHWTAALGQLNRLEDARIALAELRRCRPGLTTR